MDVASVLPYPNINIERVKLAMKLCGEHHLRSLYKHHWHKLADQLRFDRDALMSRVDEFARRLADLVPEMRRRMTKEGLDHPILDRLAEAIPARAAKCRVILQSFAAEPD